MSRESVVEMALNAYTLEECLAAEGVLTLYLAEHPGDLGLHEIAGQLGIVKAAALEREAVENMGANGPAQSAPPPPRRRGVKAGSPK